MKVRYLKWDTRSGLAPKVNPFGFGIPAKTHDLIVIIGLNDFAAFEDLFVRHDHQLACVVHGGTYTANLVGLSAAHCTLDILANTDALQTVNRAGEQVRNVLGVHFTASVPQTYRDWRKSNSALYQAFCWQLIERGVMLEPDSREPWFFCEAHQHMNLAWLEDVATQSIAAALSVDL